MKAITISESQRDAVCTELAGLVDKLKIYDNLKCIYVIPYESERSKNWQLCIEIVREVNRYKYLEGQIDFYSSRLNNIDSIAKFGVQLIPSIGDARDYQGEQYKKFRKGFLHNAMIIYDKDGSFTKLQKDEDEDKSLLFSNLCEFDPPLTTESKDVYLAKDGFSKRLVRKEK